MSVNAPKKPAPDLHWAVGSAPSPDDRPMVEPVSVPELPDGFDSAAHQIGSRLALERLMVRHGGLPAIPGTMAFNGALDTRFSAGSDPAVFVRELRTLLRDDAVVSYLQALQTELAAGRPVDLWAFTREACDGDEDKALMYLGVLFQDIGDVPEPGQLHYARTQNLGTAEARALYAEVLQQLGTSEHVRLYPESVHGVRSTALYHFYVMAHAARAATRADPCDARTIAGAAFELNNLYEYHRRGAIDIFNTVEPTLAAVRRNVALLEVLADPETFDAIIDDEDALDDTYLGYAGALFGAGLSGEMISREAFRDRFATSPAAFVDAQFF